MLLSLLVACAPCASFADMTLPSDTPALARVVADFASWTGRDGVCVPAVEWRAELSGDPDVLGRYDGPGEPILLRQTQDSSATTLRHELCHALDAEEGLADALADTLDPDAVDPLAYPDPDLRLAEAFAQACEAGPARLPLREALHESCGLNLDPTAAPLRARVYPLAPPELPVEVGTAPVATALYDHAGTVLLDAAARGDALWLLLHDGQTKSVVTWQGWALTSRQRVEGDTAALGAGDDGPLLIGERAITILEAGTPAFTGAAAAAAQADGALWVATSTALLGPDPEGETGSALKGPAPTIDVDAVASHVVATLPDGGLWLDGSSVPGIDGGASVAISAAGELLVTWYIEGIAGVAEGGDEGWVVHTSCDAGLSGAAPIWWAGSPWVAAQSAVPSVYAW